MKKYPRLLSDYYREHTEQFFSPKTQIGFRWFQLLFLATTLTFIFLVVMLPFRGAFLSLSIVSGIVWLLSLCVPRDYFNKLNGQKIMSGGERVFPNGAMKEQEIIAAFSQKNIKEVFRILNEPVSQSYQDIFHELIVDKGLLNNSYDTPYIPELAELDRLCLTIDEDASSQRYYCLLWKVNCFFVFDPDGYDQVFDPDIYPSEQGIADVLIIERPQYHILKQLMINHPAMTLIKRERQIWNGEY